MSRHINDKKDDVPAVGSPAMILEEAKFCDGELHLDLWYPRLNEVKAFVIGLIDVRAADDIRITYDFSRDGWKIEQAAVFKWDADDQTCDPGWAEVAFVEAWSREKPDGTDGGQG